MMNTAVFLLWELLGRLFFGGCEEEAVGECRVFDRFRNRSAYLRLEDYELTVNSYDFCFGGSELIMSSHRYRYSSEHVSWSCFY